MITITDVLLLTTAGRACGLRCPKCVATWGLFIEPNGRILCAGCGGDVQLASATPERLAQMMAEVKTDYTRRIGDARPEGAETY